MLYSLECDGLIGKLGVCSKNVVSLWVFPHFYFGPVNVIMRFMVLDFIHCHFLEIYLCQYCMLFGFVTSKIYLLERITLVRLGLLKIFICRCMGHICAFFFLGTLILFVNDPPANNK